jgi:hypothetical protein
MAMAALLAGGSLLLRPGSDGAPQSDLRFRESAVEVGLIHTHTKCRLSDRFANIGRWLSAVGAAAAAADVDGDGWTDLYVTSSGRGDSNRLFRNRGDGTFEDITEASGTGVGNPAGASMHAVFGDIDNDGDPDLYVVMWGTENRMFENVGQGRFVEIAESAGVDFWGYGNAATFLDYDRDGRLDLLVGNYFAEALPDPDTGELRRSDLWDPFTTRIMHESFTHARNGGRNVLYRNLGGNRFEDVTEEAGLEFTGWTLAVGAADLNNDGWPDLYLANDFGPDELHFNTGASESPPRFRPFVGTEGHPAVGDDWWKGMNVDFGDVDGNGYLDIYVTNILAPRYKTDEGNMLWLNLPDESSPGGRRFVNAGKSTGTHDGGWGWGAKLADFDNDGRLDILAVNGFSTGDPDRTYWYALQEMVTQLKNATADAADWPVMGDRDLSGYEPNRLWLQLPSEDDAALRFEEIALASGIDDLYNGRGAVVLDGDNDGDLDIYVANQGAPGVYYRNLLREDENAGAHWVAFVLEGAPPAGGAAPGATASTRDAVGARVRVVSGGRTQVREVSGGTGFASQSEMRLHFGLGQAAGLERVEIRWPGGLVQRLEGSDLDGMVDRTVRLAEGRAPEGAP